MKLTRWKLKKICINKTNSKNKIIHDNKMKIIHINKTDLKNKITHIKHITKTKIKHNKGWAKKTD